MSYEIPENVKGAAIGSAIQFYISSHNFNGISFFVLAEHLDLDERELRELLSELISEGKITLCFYSVSGNPHIKRLPDLPIAEQLELLEREDAGGICVYPSAEVLSDHVGPLDEANRPYTRALLLGEAQLSPRFFELAVLERYRLDPRYDFQFRHLRGQLSISSAVYDAEQFPEKDKILLESLGLALTNDGHHQRRIAAFLRYLSRLSAEHQHYWQGFETAAACVIVPEYYEPAIYGRWPTHMSIYDAILAEMKLIDEMCLRIGRTPLFRNTYEQRPPDGFGIILQPTSKNFDDFVHLLDKMLSENIDMKFFGAEVPLTETFHLGDGTIERRSKGSIRVLEEWFNTRWHAVEEGAVEKIVGPLKKVRELRQKPAHKIQENRYDVLFEDMQRQLVSDVYVSLRWLRLLLSDLQEVEVPAWLEEVRFRNY